MGAGDRVLGLGCLGVEATRLPPLLLVKSSCTFYVAPLSSPSPSTHCQSNPILPIQSTPPPTPPRSRAGDLHRRPQREAQGPEEGAAAEAEVGGGGTRARVLQRDRPRRPPSTHETHTGTPTAFLSSTASTANSPPSPKKQHQPQPQNSSAKGFGRGGEAGGGADGDTLPEDAGIGNSESLTEEDRKWRLEPAALREWEVRAVLSLSCCCLNWLRMCFKLVCWLSCLLCVLYLLLSPLPHAPIHPHPTRPPTPQPKELDRGAEGVCWVGARQPQRVGADPAGWHRAVERRGQPAMGAHGGRPAAPGLVQDAGDGWHRAVAVRGLVGEVVWGLGAGVQFCCAQFCRERSRYVESGRIIFLCG